MYKYIDVNEKVEKGDEVLMHQDGPDGPEEVWVTMDMVLIGWSRRYLESRLEMIGLPGRIFIRRKKN